MRRTAALCLLLGAAAAQEDVSVKSLVAKLGSKIEQERADAAHSLGQLGARARSAAPALAKALDDSSWVAKEAADALMRIGPDCVPSVVKALPGLDRWGRERALKLLDESFSRDLKPHVRAIAGLLGDEDEKVRNLAAKTLGGQGEAAIEAVLGPLGARERETSDAALAALVAIGAASVQPVVKLLSSSNADARAGAARALGALVARDAESQLLAALADKVPAVAGEAARALGAVGEPERVVPRLIDGLRCTDGPFRDGCVDGLATCGAPAVPALFAALAATDTREGATLALLKMEERGAAALGDALRGTQPVDRPALLAALGRFTPQVVPNGTFDAAFACLEDKTPAVREAAARALGSLGPRAKAGKLKDRVSEEDPAVRAAILHALGDLGVDPGLDTDPDPLCRVEALLASWKIRGGGDEEVRKIAFDASADVRVRAAAVAALGDMGLGAAQIDLAPLLEGQPVEIRRAAAAALANIVRPSALAIRDARAGAKRDAQVDQGLAWLVQAQGEDGQWDGYTYTAGTTGLALLAFLGAGIGPGADERGTAVRRGLQYLVREQAPSGVIGTTQTHEHLVCTGIATLALTEAYVLTGDCRWRRAAQWGLDCIGWARNPKLAWRYDPRGGENDTHVTAWLLFATRLGDAAGLRVDRASYAGAGKWIVMMTDKDFGITGYNYPGGQCARPEKLQDRFPADRTRAMTAAGLWCRHLLGGAYVAAPEYELGVDEVLEVEPHWEDGVQDLVYWHFATLALFHDGDANFRKWAKPLAAALARGREKNGAWRNDDVWASDLAADSDYAKGASVYSTSMALLALLTPTRYPRDFLAKPKLSAATRASIAALKKACADEDAQVRAVATAACARLGG